MPADPLHCFVADYERLTATGAADAALHEWQRRDDFFTGFATAAALGTELDRIQVEADYSAGDALLHALLRIAGAGGSVSHIAALLVAARMVPAAGRIVGQLTSAARRSGRPVTVVDARATVAGCLWEQVRTFPLARRHRVAGNLAAEVLGHSLRVHDCHPRCTGRAVPVDPGDLTAPAVVERQASEQVVRLLSWAVTSHVLSRAQSDLLLARWATGDAPVPARVLSEQWGLPRRTVAHRCARAERALAAAVRDATAA